MCFDARFRGEDGYFSERKMSSREIYPFHLVNWSRRNDHALNIQLSVKELSNVAIDSLNADIQNNSKLIQRIRNALEHVISEHLIEGFGYLRVLLRWKNLGFCGNIFYSGTPKLVGRLLSAILREVEKIGGCMRIELGQRIQKIVEIMIFD